MSALPQAVRDAATFGVAHGPEPVRGLPIERVFLPGLALLVMPGPLGSLVEPRAIPDAPKAIAQVREVYRASGKDRAIWWVAEAAEPAGLTATLIGLGLDVFDEPPHEARFAAMAMASPPPAVPHGVEVRPAASFEEYVAAADVGNDAFAMPDEERRAWERHHRVRWELQASGASPALTFVALVQGEIVGSGTALLAPSHVVLVGGAVQAEHRGRGVYRALLRARWEAAAARGTPVLTVQAGSMSRPVLERAGFATVGWSDCLIDRFGSGT